MTIAFGGARLARRRARFKVRARRLGLPRETWTLSLLKLMSTKILFPLALLVGLSAAAFSTAQSPALRPSPVALPAEKHLRNVRQLTNGGENAEAYFSADGRELIFQSKRDALECDQIFTMSADGSN